MLLKLLKKEIVQEQEADTIRVHLYNMIQVPQFFLPWDRLNGTLKHVNGGGGRPVDSDILWLALFKCSNKLDMCIHIFHPSRQMWHSCQFESKVNKDIKRVNDVNAWRDYRLSHDSLSANAMDRIATDNLCFPESVPTLFLPCMLFPWVLISVKADIW